MVFLRKLAPGGSEHSFGIHVAKLAGMPDNIVRRASQVLEQLESADTTTEVPQQKADVQPVPEADTPAPAKSRKRSRIKTPGRETLAGMQLSFFQLDDPVLKEVRDEIIGADINNMTPLEALTKLHNIRKILTGKE